MNRLLVSLFLLVGVGSILIGCAPTVSEANISGADTSTNQALEAEAVNYSHALALQYAQPWLDKQTEISATGSKDALAMQYAQPWLDQQQIVSSPTVQYSNALAMQYAQPWLDAQQKLDCNGRLDEMYACQNSNRK